MRQSILNLQLNGQRGIQSYGKNLLVDDELPTGQCNAIWDLFSQCDENEDSYGSESQDPTQDRTEYQQVRYNLKWLRNQCIAFTTRKTRLDAHPLQDQVSVLLASDQSGAISVIVHDLMEH